MNSFIHLDEQWKCSQNTSIEKFLTEQKCGLDNSTCVQVYHNPYVDPDVFDLDDSTENEDTFVIEVFPFWPHSPLLFRKQLFVQLLCFVDNKPSYENNSTSFLMLVADPELKVVYSPPAGTPPTLKFYKNIQDITAVDKVCFWFQVFFSEQLVSFQSFGDFYSSAASDLSSKLLPRAACLLVGLSTIRLL